MKGGTWLRLAAMAALVALPGLAFAQDGRAADLVPTGEVLGKVIEGAVMGSDQAQVSASVRLIVLLTALSFLPGLLMLMTPFTRFIIVFSLLRQALGVQQAPPNQVLVALSLMLSLVVMQPTLERVNESALQPYLNSEMDTVTFYTESMGPMREFMFTNVGRQELATALKISRVAKPATLDEVSTPILATAFVLSEVKIAFVTAVKIYIPFLVIDLIVASSLLGMGMMMVPPVVISLPFKLLVFVLMDGWDLVIYGLASGVR